MPGTDIPLLTSSLDDGITRIRLSGDLDLPHTPDIQRALEELIEAGHTRLLIDLTDVTFIASSGLGVLLSIHRLLERVGGQLAVLCPEPSMRGLFELVGHTLVFPTEPTIEQALSGLTDASAAEPPAKPAGPI